MSGTPLRLDLADLAEISHREVLDRICAAMRAELSRGGNPDVVALQLEQALPDPVLRPVLRAFLTVLAGGIGHGARHPVAPADPVASATPPAPAATPAGSAPAPPPRPPARPGPPVSSSRRWQDAAALTRDLAGWTVWLPGGRSKPLRDCTYEDLVAAARQCRAKAGRLEQLAGRYQRLADALTSAQAAAIRDLDHDAIQQALA